jgi:Flp pilus assembly protein TadG
MRAEKSRGSMTVEVLLLTPVLVMLVMLIIYAGRMTEASIRVHRAADVGARVASISNDSSMFWKGELAAHTDMRLSKSPCHNIDVAVRKSRIDRLVTVTTTVSCTVPIAGLGLLPPRAQRVHASSTEVIDFYTGRS